MKEITIFLNDLDEPCRSYLRETVNDMADELGYLILLKKEDRTVILTNHDVEQLTLWLGEASSVDFSYKAREVMPPRGNEISKKIKDFADDLNTLMKGDIPRIVEFLSGGIKEDVLNDMINAVEEGINSLVANIED